MMSTTAAAVTAAALSATTTVACHLRCESSVSDVTDVECKSCAVRTPPREAGQAFGYFLAKFGHFLPPFGYFLAKFGYFLPPSLAFG
jgi:hypothetical protein